MRLCNSTLDRLPAAVAVPDYPRAALRNGIVHLGIGAFARAHLAAYTEPLLSADPRWGIAGVSLRQAATRDALAAQDGLYTLAERDGGGERLRVVGALTGLAVAPESPPALLAQLSHPDVRIVSLTVTEKGYCHDPASGGLAIGHADVVHDLANPTAPRSVPGILVSALKRRRAQGLAPVTLLSCDNLPGNGTVLRRLVLEFAALQDPALATTLANSLSCPNTMVDRIVPATTDADRDHIAGRLGMTDAWPVVTEPFRQWVIEDRFSAGRPAWEDTGAVLVDDVLPFERMKLRLLNGSHSALAYLGVQLGLDTVAQAVADESLHGFLRRMMDEDITPTLSLPADFDLTAYKRALLQRFANPALHHRLLQIAMDGSQKLPQRLLEPIRHRLEAGAPIAHLALAVAAWMRHLLGEDEHGRRYAIDDPMADRLTRLATAAGRDAGALAGALLSVGEVFGRDLPRDARFRAAVTDALQALLEGGVRRALGAPVCNR